VKRSTQRVRDEDVASIQQTIAELARIFHARDVAGIMSHFREDAVYVDIFGVPNVGSDSILAAATLYLIEAPEDAALRFDVVNIAFVRNDVAAVTVRHDPITTDGEILVGEPVGQSMFVMSHEKADWKIAVWQLTVIGRR